MRPYRSSKCRQHGNFNPSWLSYEPLHVQGVTHAQLDAEKLALDRDSSRSICPHFLHSSSHPCKLLAFSTASSSAKLGA